MEWSCTGIWRRLRTPESGQWSHLFSHILPLWKQFDATTPHAYVTEITEETGCELSDLIKAPQGTRLRFPDCPVPETGTIIAWVILIHLNCGISLQAGTSVPARNPQTSIQEALCAALYLFTSTTLADCEKSVVLVDILVRWGKNGVISRGILSAGLSSGTGLELIISI